MKLSAAQTGTLGREVHGLNRVLADGKAHNIGTGTAPAISS